MYSRYHKYIFNYPFCEQDWIEDQNYSLYDTYGEDFGDLIADIPDPTRTPLDLIRDFLGILDQLGNAELEEDLNQFLDTKKNLITYTSPAETPECWGLQFQTSHICRQFRHLWEIVCKYGLCLEL